jgi:transposase
LGLVPSTHQSGKRCYHGPITKQGHRHARALLVQAAHHVAEHPGPLGAFFRRVAKRRGYNGAVVAQQFPAAPKCPKNGGGSAGVFALC